MYKKILILIITVVLPILAIELSNFEIKHPKTTHSVKDGPKNTYEYTVALLEELNGTLAEKIESASDEIQSVITNVGDFMTSTINASRTQIEEAYNALVEDLNTIKGSAADAAIDISECLDQREDQLTQLPRQLSNEMIACVTNRADEVVGFLYDLASDAKGTLKTIDSLSTQLEICGPDISMTLCVVPVLQEVLVNFDLLPQRIDSDVSSASQRGLASQANLQNCSDTRVAQVIEAGSQIITDINTCVNNLFIK